MEHYSIVAPVLIMASVTALTLRSYCEPHVFYKEYAHYDFYGIAVLVTIVRIVALMAIVFMSVMTLCKWP